MYCVEVEINVWLLALFFTGVAQRVGLLWPRLFLYVARYDSSLMYLIP